MSNLDTSDTETIRQPSKVVFRYNPLHDFESLWWIAVYFFVTGTLRIIPPAGCDTAPEKYPVEPWYKSEVRRMALQHRMAEELFVHCSTRRLAMVNLDWFASDMSVMHQTMGSVGTGLDRIRRTLAGAYKGVENDVGNIPLYAASSVYTAFHQFFLGIQTRLKSDGDVIVAPL